MAKLEVGIGLRQVEVARSRVVNGIGQKVLVDFDSGSLANSSNSA